MFDLVLRGLVRVFVIAPDGRVVAIERSARGSEAVERAGGDGWNAQAKQRPGKWCTIPVQPPEVGGATVEHIIVSNSATGLFRQLGRDLRAGTVRQGQEDDVVPGQVFHGGFRQFTLGQGM